MPLHAKLTEEIRTGPTGSKVGAFFDLDRTLLAGFSASSFMRERFSSGRSSTREILDTISASIAFAAGRTGFSGLMSAGQRGMRRRWRSMTTGRSR